MFYLLQSRKYIKTIVLRALYKQNKQHCIGYDKKVYIVISL